MCLRFLDTSEREVSFGEKGVDGVELRLVAGGGVPERETRRLNRLFASACFGEKFGALEKRRGESRRGLERLVKERLGFREALPVEQKFRVLESAVRVGSG